MKHCLVQTVLYDITLVHIAQRTYIVLPIHVSLNVLLLLLTIIYINSNPPTESHYIYYKPIKKVDQVVLTQIDEACGYGDLEMLTIKAYS